MKKKRSNIRANEPRVIHLWAIISAQSRDLTEQLFVLIKIYTQLKVSNQFPLNSKGVFSTNTNVCWLSLQRGCLFIYENSPRSPCFPWGNLLVQTRELWDNTLPERFLRKEIAKRQRSGVISNYFCKRLKSVTSCESHIRCTLTCSVNNQKIGSFLCLREHLNK